MRMVPTSLVGRSALCESLQQHLGNGGNVILQGPAGIGKTRIAAHVCADRRNSTEHVDRLLGNERRAAILLSLLAPLGPPPTVSLDDQAGVFGWFLRRWRERSSDGAPALVWADDIHHCDPLSEAILRHAVSAGVVQLVATHRNTEVLGAGVQALITEGLLTPWRVDSLEQPDADMLAQAMSETVLEQAGLDRVHALAAGNPLFIREVVTSLNGGVDVAESTTLHTIMGRPLMALSAANRRAFDLVAVADPAPTAVLRPRWDDVRELISVGLLTEHEDGTVRVDHPLRRVWALADLGSSASVAWADLLDVVHREALHEGMDPVTLTDWHMRAGRSPPAALVERAVRLAIARRDAQTAMQFVGLLNGPVATLLRGEALIVSGDVREGVGVLAELSADAPARVRAEAAFWQARYIALMLGDYPRAEAVLDAVDDPQLPQEVRRVVLSGRLWLWVFGPITGGPAMTMARGMSLHGPADEVTFEMCHVTAAVMSEIADPQLVAPLIQRCHQLEEAIEISTAALMRARTVAMWWEASRGEGERARRIGRDACARAAVTSSLESLALLAGSVGWLTALTGRITEARRISGAVEMVPQTDDWFQFRTLAALVHEGNEYLGSGCVRGLAPTEDPFAAGARPDLGHLFSVRACVLGREGRGEPVDAAELECALRVLISNRKHRWAAFFGLELASMCSGRTIHELLWRSSNLGPSSGVVAISGRVARARLDGDCTTLLHCGQQLEWGGFYALALRVLADAVHLTDRQELAGSQARGGLLRALHRWDGAYPPWLTADEAVPTPRQMDIVWSLARGRTAAEVADRLFLSTRTVENHLHRAYRTLGVHGREELLAMLRPVRRPTEWQMAAHLDG